MVHGPWEPIDKAEKTINGVGAAQQYLLQYMGIKKGLRH